MTTQTEAIIARIREVCPEMYTGTKRLVKLDRSTESIETYETIHLEHLLRAILSVDDLVTISFYEGVLLNVIDGKKPDSYYEGRYDLTLTVEQNLEQNESLREWLYELICKEV